MDRALFTSSIKSFSFSSPLRCPRSPTRFTSSSDSDNYSGARFLIEHFERHNPQNLQIACLAMQLSDLSGDNEWPQGFFKENGTLSAVASLLGFFGSFKAVKATPRKPSCKWKRKDYACHCSAEHGSSLGEPAAFNQSNEGLQLAGIKEKIADSIDCSARGLVGPIDTRIDDGAPKTEQVKLCENSPSSITSSIVEGVSIPVKEPIYEVLEVKLGGNVITKSVSRRLLLKTSGLRLRDIRSVDPSLWVTNAAPALLIRDQAILLNLGSLRAIASADNVLIFDYKSVGAVAFLDLLLQRLNPDSNPGLPAMPFELEVVEAALLSRTQRLERRLMEIEPRVLSLLEALPNYLTANILEELRVSKQALVELGSKSGALRQMLLEILESPQEIRRMTIMGRQCTISKEDGSVECMASSDKQLADDEEEEMEMLLENYLQRCESCHGQAERLLDSAKEMEDSIAVNLSSRRLEVSRLELLLQVGTFCAALGALVAGVFGMNLRSYLEGSGVAFWLTTAGIVLGGIVLFFVMYNHLRQKKIL